MTICDIRVVQRATCRSSDLGDPTPGDYPCSELQYRLSTYLQISLIDSGTSCDASTYVSHSKRESAATCTWQLWCVSIQTTISNTIEAHASFIFFHRKWQYSCHWEPNWNCQDIFRLTLCYIHSWWSDREKPWVFFVAHSLGCMTINCVREREHLRISAILWIPKMVCAGSSGSFDHSQRC